MGSAAPVPQAYTPPDQAGAASGLSGAASSLTNLGNTTTNAAIPGYQSIYNAVTTNPYYQQAQTAANTTGQAGTQFGQGEINTAQGLTALGNNLGQYGQGIIANAFDPQGALYNQQQTQNMNQINAINGQNGVAGSPYGASVAGQSNQNFNLNWLNNEQTRQNAGISALGQLDSTTSGLDTAAGDLGASGLNNMTTGGQAANSAYLANQNSIESALNALVSGDASAGAPYSQAGALDTSYLGIGQQAASTNVQGYEAQQQADQAFWSGIGSLFGLGAGSSGNGTSPFSTVTGLLGF